jgi:CRISPR-associated protein Cas1
VLLSECVLAVRATGLDPALGCLHQPHHDQPALALDLMEEFRPIMVDASVLDLTRRHQITAADGIAEEDRGVRISAAARATLIQAIEARLQTTRTPGPGAAPCTLRELLQRQARLLRDALLGRGVYAPLPLP